MSGHVALPAACNRDCGATCALIAKTRRDGSMFLARNPLNHPLKMPCPRGLRALETRNAGDRLTRPLIRTGERGSGAFKEVGWATALQTIAEGMRNTIDSSGAEAILNFGGSGACKGALHNTNHLTSRFLEQLGPVTRLEGSYSFQASSFVKPYIFGSTPIGYDAQTLLESRFVLLWGANISDTRFGNETEQVIRYIKSQGGEVIVIDPRNTRTAKQLGTSWIPILPGGDSAMMLAMAQVLHAENLIDSHFISRYVHGSDDFFRYVSGETDGISKSPEWASPICGVSTDDIRDLARRYGRAKPAALIPGFSLQRALGGEETYRLTSALQAITGNAGIDGGTPGTNPWSGLDGPGVPALKAPPGAGQTIPKATWPQGILGRKNSGSAVNFKAAYMVGNNYLNQGSDIQSGIAALKSLEFIVCHELFLTPGAQYADVVLPATHYLEREDIIMAEDNYLYYSARIFEPVGEARNDFDIFDELSGIMGLGSGFSGGKNGSEWIDWMIDESAIGHDGSAEFKETGIFDGGNHKRNGLSSFIADPLEAPLSTPSGRIEICSEEYTETGFPAWPVFRSQPQEPQHPLRLITPHSRYRINSTGTNIPWVAEKDPVVLWMNPADARHRRLSDGETVRIYNGTGSMNVPVRVTEDVMPGVVSCIQGGWHGSDSSPSVNILTPLEPTLPSIGTRTHTVLVEVESTRNVKPVTSA